MKWYNYKNEWINIEKMYAIELNHDTLIRFHYSSDDVHQLFFPLKEERDAEFEKIKKLMGVYEITSRCC